MEYAWILRFIKIATLEFSGIRFGHIKHDSYMFHPNKRPLFYMENVSNLKKNDKVRRYIKLQYLYWPFNYSYSSIYACIHDIDQGRRH